MTNIIRLTASDGSAIEFIDEIKASGAMKDVYFSPNKRYVVALFRKKNDDALKERLQLITGQYRERIFGQKGGDYWRGLYCWPTATVEYQGKIGVVI